MEGVRWLACVGVGSHKNRNPVRAEEVALFVGPLFVGNDGPANALQTIQRQQ